MWLCSVVTLYSLACYVLLKRLVHNNLIIIRSSVSKILHLYDYIYPDPKIICTCSEGLFPPLSLSLKFRARFQNITVFWMWELFWISMDTCRWHHSTVKINEPYWKSGNSAFVGGVLFINPSGVLSSQFLIKPEP